MAIKFTLFVRQKKTDNVLICTEEDVVIEGKELFLTCQRMAMLETPVKFIVFIVDIKITAFFFLFRRTIVSV